MRSVVRYVAIVVILTVSYLLIGMTIITLVDHGIVRIGAISVVLLFYFALMAHMRHALQRVL